MMCQARSVSAIVQGWVTILRGEKWLSVKDFFDGTHLAESFTGSFQGHRLSGEGCLWRRVLFLHFLAFGFLSK